MNDVQRSLTALRAARDKHERLRDAAPKMLRALHEAADLLAQPQLCTDKTERSRVLGYIYAAIRDATGE